MMNATTRKKQVRFSDSSIVYVFNTLSLTEEQASKLWYSKEETDRFKAWHSRRLQEIRSLLKDSSALEERITINDVTSILGFEKYLATELKAAYKEKRLALQTAVLAEHRWHRAVDIPHSTEMLANTSAMHSRWARKRARAAALLLEQDVLQDLEDPQTTLSKEADATEDP